MNKKKSAHMAALYGMLIALAFVLSFVESLIPISLGIPGVKTGVGKSGNRCGALHRGNLRNHSWSLFLELY